MLSAEVGHRFRLLLSRDDGDDLGSVGERDLDQCTAETAGSTVDKDALSCLKVSSYTQCEVGREQVHRHSRPGLQRHSLRQGQDARGGDCHDLGVASGAGDAEDTVSDSEAGDSFSHFAYRSGDLGPHCVGQGWLHLILPAGLQKFGECHACIGDVDENRARFGRRCFDVGEPECARPVGGVQLYCFHDVCSSVFTSS